MPDKMTSNKPYVVRAFYEWILDNDLTPYVVVDATVYGVLVPLAYVKDNQIVLNVAPDSVGSISLVGDALEFSARFGGKLEHISVPYGAVAAIYAKENGAGTSLAIEHPKETNQREKPQPLALSAVDTEVEDKPAKPIKSKGRASLKVIK